MRRAENMRAEVRGQAALKKAQEDLEKKKYEEQKIIIARSVFTAVSVLYVEG